MPLHFRMVSPSEAGAAARLMEDVGGSMRGPVAGTTDVLARARSELGTADYEQAVADGRRASIDAVIATAAGAIRHSV